MLAIQAQISEKFQVVIPKEVRQKLDLQPRSTLLFLIYDDTVLIRPKPASFTDALRGLHQEVWKDVNVDEWLNEERSSWG